MRTRLAVAVLALLLLATPAWAALSDIVSTGADTPIYTLSGLDCSAGKVVQVRSHTYGFGFLDSTGTTYLLVKPTASGVWTGSVQSGEHDGVVRTYKTPYNVVYQGGVEYRNLSSVGTGAISLSCVAA